MIATGTTDEIIYAPSSRLAGGDWCHDSNRKIGEGDIYASYSADTIGTSNRIRKPFRLNGCLWTTVSISGQSVEMEAIAYRLANIVHFDGTPTTYGEVCRGAWDQTNGFYHSMAVSHGSREYVLCGPPVILRGDNQPEPVQGSLF